MKCTYNVNIYIYIYVKIFLIIRQTALVIGSVMVSMLTSSVVDNGFESQSDQTEDYKICICCISEH